MVDSLLLVAVHVSTYNAVSASAFGLRFQGKGCFLTDARMHRGSSGSPVVMRSRNSSNPALPWILLGIHSAKFDMGTRDLELDEALGLNCAWYADILMALTKDTSETLNLLSPADH